MRKFVSPSVGEKVKAVGTCTKGAHREWIQPLAKCWAALSEPGIDDWLLENQEPGQTFSQFINSPHKKLYASY
jgi:hypothetical protein